jgi:heptose I phosphotransferase
MGGTFWQRLLRGSWHVAVQPDWPTFAGPGWTERIMSVSLSDQFHAKQGRSTARWVLDAPTGKLVVFLKRHYELGRWRGLLATLFPRAGWSPAMQEGRHLEQAAALGLPVPRAVAAGERIGPWGRFQSFLAVQELTDMLPLHEAIPAAARRLGPADFVRWKRTLVVELARLARALHDRRLFHKDFYLCHFFISEQDTRTIPDWRGRVQLIDLHRLGRHPWTWRLWQAKDLAQLVFSSDIDEIDSRDRLRFWIAYTDEDRHTLKSRLLRWFVMLKWRAYRRHNLKHHRTKAGKPLS